MLKTEIRDRFRQKRRDLSVAQRNKLDDLLLIRFQSAELPFIYSLLSYWPIERNGEPNAHLFTDWLAFRNPELVIAYPLSDFKTGEMNAVIPGEQGFEEDRFGLHQPVNGETLLPADIDMVLVPLLAFDQEGYRVGYGKGFYDRFLKACYNSLKVGFSYFEPIEEISDKGEFDVPLDLCITPQNVYVF